MVCLDTPTSRATSSTARPASTCFKALIISASLCLPLDMVLPLSFDEIIFNFVRNQGSRSLNAAPSGVERKLCGSVKRPLVMDDSYALPRHLLMNKLAHLCKAHYHTQI